MCTKDMLSRVSIDTLNRPMIDIRMTSQRKLDWHPDRYLVNTQLTPSVINTWLTLDQQSVVSRPSVDRLMHWSKISRLLTEMSIQCWSRVPEVLTKSRPSINRVLIKGQPRASTEGHSTMDACSTHDPGCTL